MRDWDVGGEERLCRTSSLFGRGVVLIWQGKNLELVRAS